MDRIVTLRRPPLDIGLWGRGLEVADRPRNLCQRMLLRLLTLELRKHIDALLTLNVSQWKHLPSHLPEAMVTLRARRTINAEDRP